MIRIGPSLYTRLVVRVGLVLAISASALLIAIWISSQLAADEAYDRILTGSALQIAENTWYQNDAVNVDVPLAAFSMLTAGDQVFYTVLDPNGRSVAGDADFKPDIPWDRLADGPLLRDGHYQEIPVRIAIIGRRMPVASPHPWAVIVLAQTGNGRLSFAKSLGTKALLVILVMGILTVIAAMFTLYQALSPLKRIEDAIRQRDLNDLSPLALTVPSEIHALVSAINAFMQRLATHRSLMRRVIGDAAHQLRTPVAALMAQMELLSAPGDDHAKARHLERLQERTRQLGALVNQLINHAMVQHRAETVTLEPVDLTALVRQEMMAMLSHQERRIAFDMDAPEQACMVLADAVSVREAIRNILGNALQYGAHSLLHVRLRVNEDTVALDFIDDGPGITEADWERLRKPFAARSQGRAGASLGLSIVDQVMRAHDGELLFARLSDGSFCVGLRFRRQH